MDLLIADESPAQISDHIKDILFSKSAERISNVRPEVAASIFDDNTESVEDDNSEVE